MKYYNISSFYLIDAIRNISKDLTASVIVIRSIVPKLYLSCHYDGIYIFQKYCDRVFLIAWILKLSHVLQKSLFHNCFKIFDLIFRLVCGVFLYIIDKKVGLHFFRIVNFMYFVIVWKLNVEKRSDPETITVCWAKVYCGFRSQIRTFSRHFEMYKLLAH